MTGFVLSCQSLKKALFYATFCRLLNSGGNFFGIDFKIRMYERSISKEQSHL
jgi:hypothetical protein